MTEKQIGLRTALAITAILVAYTGIDNALGGIATLGLQGPTDFFAVTNDPAFFARDSHVRFLGGVWLGVALVFLAGAFWLGALRQALATVSALAFVGGLSRLASLSVDDAISHGLAAPLAAELFILPLLGLWVSRRPTRDRISDGFAPSSVR